MAIVILNTLFLHIWQNITIAHNCTSMCIFYDHLYWRFAWNSINLDIFPLLQLKLMTHKFVLLSYLVLNTLNVFRMLAVYYLRNWAFILFFIVVIWWHYLSYTIEHICSNMILMQFPWLHYHRYLSYDIRWTL